MLINYYFKIYYLCEVKFRIMSDFFIFFVTLPIFWWHSLLQFVVDILFQYYRTLSRNFKLLDKSDV